MYKKRLCIWKREATKSFMSLFLTSSQQFCSQFYKSNFKIIDQSIHYWQAFGKRLKDVTLSIVIPHLRSDLFCVIGREKTSPAAQSTFPPWCIRTVQYFNDFTETEAQLVIFLCCEVIHCSHLYGWPLKHTHTQWSVSIIKGTNILLNFVP